jgi:hypothetical protein
MKDYCERLFVTALSLRIISEEIHGTFAHLSTGMHMTTGAKLYLDTIVTELTLNQVRIAVLHGKSLIIGSKSGTMNVLGERAHPLFEFVNGVCGARACRFTFDPHAISKVQELCTSLSLGMEAFSREIGATTFLEVSSVNFECFLDVKALYAVLYGGRTRATPKRISQVLDMPRLLVPPSY